MKLSVLQDDGATVRISVTGQVTQRELVTSPDPLAGVLSPEQYSRQVVFDMSNASYLDSSGVGWLLSCSKRFRQEGGRLALQSLTPVVSNVVRVLKLEKVFNLAGEAEEASSSKGGAA